MAPRILATCSRCVFKSFKKFERWSERFVSRIGPFFVGLAVLLIGGCAFTYFDVVFRERFLAPDASNTALVLGSVWSAWLVWMFSFHYYKAITVPPGSPLDPPRATPDRRAWPTLIPSALCVGPLRGLATQGKDDRRRSKAVREIAAAQERRLVSGGGGGDGGATPSASLGLAGAQNPEGKSARAQRHERVCRKCPEGPTGPQVKPERTHHCSVCRKCTLKFDHHCPWISGCVGLHNERYFLLFLCYFSVACGTVSVLGWRSLLFSLAFGSDWPYYSPRVFVLLLWVLALVMCFAVGIMGIFQIWLVALGETAVESHDNDWYRKTAKARGRTFRNPYHLGWRPNLAEFFNVGPNGYHWLTILLPVEIPPASDGWTYQKIPGWQEFAMDFDDELTDEEEMSDEE